MQSIARSLALYSVVMSITACAPASSSGVERPVLRELGQIGVTSPAVQPDTDISGFPPKGVAEGALVGTAAGSVVGAFECLIFFYPLVPAYPICMAVFATAGTGAGIAAAERGEIVDAAQEKFTGVLTERDWQALLRQNVVKLAAEKYRINAADLGAPHLQAENLDTTEDVQEHGQAQQAETGHIYQAASTTLFAHTDTLMEVTLVKLSTWFSGDHKFGFVLTGQAQLIRSSDLVVFTSSTHYYVSPSLPLPEWVARDGALIGDCIMTGIDYLAQEMVREHLHTP